jgi:hypothetical protein
LRQRFDGNLAAFNIQGRLRAHIDTGAAERAEIIGLSCIINDGNGTKGAGLLTKTAGVAFFYVDSQHSGIR